MRKNLSLLLALCAFYSYSQRNMFAFEEFTSVKVMHGMDSVQNPWDGGINYGEVNKIDLNGDGLEDLVVFDRVGNRITTYITRNNGNAVDYIYAPQYRDIFPYVEDWMLLKDYNCDGKKDLFIGDRGSVKVYQNVGSAGEPAFTIAHSTPHLRADYSGNTTNLFTPITDLPGITDIDNDGDLDFITFGNQTNYVEWIENTQNCGLNFSYRQSCWGHFLESNFTNKVFINSCTPFKYKSMHSGGSILPLDLNGDNVKELLISDISFNNVLALYNNGTADSAFMYAQDTLFPSYNVPVNLMRFPAGFHEDVTDDGLKDLIFSPHENLAGAASYNSMWLYENTGTAANPVFNLTTKRFMQNTMIDMGEGSVPRLVDLDGNSLPDLILANAGFLDNSGNYTPTFRYYKNIGTPNSPIFYLQDSNFVNISSYNLGKMPIPTFGDLDSDGDLDMIVGDTYGNMHLFNNTGSSHNPNFVLNTAAGFTMDVGSDAAPFLFDMDGDGDLDLLSGNRRGKIFYYENQSATSPDFVLTNDFLGGVDVRGLYSSFGQSVPYVFEHDSIINLMVGSEDGIHQFDSVSKVISLPYLVSSTFGNGTIQSTNHNDSPFGITKKSGRNQMLLKASELKAQGFAAGFITSLAFEVTTSSNPNLYGINISMANTSLDSLSGFVDKMDSVLLDGNIGISKGWSQIQFDYPFLWDGKSNLVIEVCFGGFLTNNIIKVNMTDTQFPSHAWGDITNFNTNTADGCKMPYLHSSTIRPNIRMTLTPAFAKTNVVLSDGFRNAAAFHDFDQDGFVDAILGNYAGGVGYYKGKLYDVSIEEKEAITSGYLQVYPNPGSGIFKVISNNVSRAKLQVFNLNGALIKSIEVKEETTIVDLQDQAKGIYLFILRDGNTLKIQKVINE